MNDMEICQWCSEEIGEERRCRSCGRIQYRYALDEGTNEAAARTAASDAEQSRIDDLYGREDVLQEIVEVLAESTPEPFATTPPPLKRREPPPVQPISRVPEHGGPIRTDRSTSTPGQTRTIAGCFVSTLLLGIGLFFVVTISRVGSTGEPIDFTRIFTLVPVLVLVLLFRRRLRNRNR